MAGSGIAVVGGVERETREKFSLSLLKFLFGLGLESYFASHCGLA